MRDYPKTLNEARKIIYGCWAGNPTGRPYKEGRCAYPVIKWYTHQCPNKNGKGINGLYCGIHANKVTPKDKESSSC